MKIRGMLVTGAAMFLGLLLIILALTVKLLSGGGDAQYINLAGRQRMLSQKLSKEMLVFIANPSQKQLEAVEQTELVFTRTAQALRAGGPAPSKTDNTADVDVAAPTDPELLAKLDEVGGNWEKMSAALDKLGVAGLKRGEAMKKIADNSANLLSTMEEAVSLFPPQESALALNIAGRQRMLSQKLSKDTMMYIADVTPELKQSLQDTMAHFAKSHSALRSGGSTTVGGRSVTIDAMTAPAVAAKLETADRYWKEMEAALNVLLGEGLVPEARAAFVDLNPKVLKGMDDAVSIAEHVSQAKIKTLQNTQLGIMGIGLLLVLGTIVLASKIGASIAKLQKAAEQISLGGVSKPVEVGGIGELRELSAAFERMRVSLALAVEQLGGGDDDDDGTPELPVVPPFRTT